MARILDIASFLNEYQKLECGIRDKNPLYYWWIPLDRPILAACKDHPAHSDYCEVYAKVALVNRMYSANLAEERAESTRRKTRLHKPCANQTLTSSLSRSWASTP